MGLLLLSGAAHGRPAVAEAQPAPAPAPAPTLVGPTYAVTLTGYNAVPGQTDENPFETAAGTFSNPEIVAARSQDLAKELPFGTIIEIIGPEKESATCGYSVAKPSIGYRIIEDTMNAKFTDRIDVLFDVDDSYTLSDGRTLNAGNVLGICGGVTVKAVGRVDLSRPDRVPTTQAGLTALVAGKATATDGLALR